jgi:hypothetical protein
MMLSNCHPLPLTCGFGRYICGCFWNGAEGAMERVSPYLRWLGAGINRMRALLPLYSPQNEVSSREVIKKSRGTCFIYWSEKGTKDPLSRKVTATRSR